jgi:hypothetical protein
MKCPAEIGGILSELIGVGLLQVRTAGWAGDANLCAAIADHLHNVPHLLDEFTQDGLEYYWEVERPQLRGSADEETLREFEPLWDRLEPYVLTEAAASKKT